MSEDPTGINNVVDPQNDIDLRRLEVKQPQTTWADLEVAPEIPAKVIDTLQPKNFNLSLVPVLTDFKTGLIKIGDPNVAQAFIYPLTNSGHEATGEFARNYNPNYARNWRRMTGGIAPQYKARGPTTNEGRARTALLNQVEQKAVELWNGGVLIVDKGPNDYGHPGIKNLINGLIAMEGSQTFQSSASERTAITPLTQTVIENGEKVQYTLVATQEMAKEDKTKIVSQKAGWIPTSEVDKLKESTKHIRDIK